MFSRLFSPPEVSPPQSDDGGGADTADRSGTVPSPTASTPTRALFRDDGSDEVFGAQGVNDSGGRAVIDSPTGPWSVGDFFPARGESKQAATKAPEQTPPRSSLPSPGPSLTPTLPPTATAPDGVEVSSPLARSPMDDPGLGSASSDPPIIPTPTRLANLQRSHQRSAGRTPTSPSTTTPHAESDHRLNSLVEELSDHLGMVR